MCVSPAVSRLSGMGYLDSENEDGKDKRDSKNKLTLVDSLPPALMAMCLHTNRLTYLTMHDMPP